VDGYNLYYGLLRGTKLKWLDLVALFESHVLAPVPGSDHRYIAGDLKQHAHWAKPLSMTHLSKAQLPDRIPASAIHKPLAWV
jgi:hypothetical protein